VKISDVLKKKVPTVSVEIFPPRKDSDMRFVMDTVTEVASCGPSFISVTYGAGNTPCRRTTVEIVDHIQRNLGVTGVAHLTCVSSTREEVAKKLTDMKARGVKNVLALRGDLSRDREYPMPGEYRYASELVEDIRRFGDFCIGAACYPEGHVECSSRAEDLGHLKEKVDAGCDFLITQMFFDNDVLYNFLYRLRDKGITVPVAAGIMPVTRISQVKRMCEMSGTTILPKNFASILDKFGSRPEALRQAGIAYATEQAIELIAGGVEHIHIYSMNTASVACSIMQSLSGVINNG